MDRTKEAVVLGTIRDVTHSIQESAEVDLPVDAARVIAARHEVGADQVQQVPGGVANHAFALGEHLFLRVPRGEAEAADLRREAAVIPVALRVGVRTPEIVEWDESRSLVEVPYMVLERVPGRDLEALGLVGERRAAVLRELGRELARLHRVTEADAGAPAGVERDGGGDPRGLVERLAREGWIDPGTADWLMGWFARLEGRFTSAGATLRLLHGDVAAQNVMVDPATGTLRALLDWGDACWADAGMELAKLTLDDVVTVLEGYGEEGRVGGDGELEARALWYHLSWGLSGAARGRPRPGERHWTAPPLSRVLDILRFFTSSPLPERWAELR